jgi:hypothetical protein
MPRRSIKLEVTERLREFLAVAEEQQEIDLGNVSEVARRLETSRSTLYKYGLIGEIEEAARRQMANARGLRRESEKEALRTRIRDLKKELAEAEERIGVLLDHVVRYEVFIASKGWDPEEALKTDRDVKPDRTVPAYRGRRMRRVK